MKFVVEAAIWDRAAQRSVWEVFSTFDRFDASMCCRAVNALIASGDMKMGALSARVRRVDAD